jgi:hypothetical protein
MKKQVNFNIGNHLRVQLNDPSLSTINEDSKINYNDERSNKVFKETIENYLSDVQQYDLP